MMYAKRLFGFSNNNNNNINSKKETEEQKTRNKYETWKEKE